LKEHLFPSFNILKDCIEMAGLMISNIKIKEGILEDEKYKYLFSVEEVNKQVLTGTAFRNAYKKTGIDIALGTYVYEAKVNHTHEGSIGNLCNEEIKKQMGKTVKSFPFEQVNAAIKKLLS